MFNEFSMSLIRAEVKKTRSAFLQLSETTFRLHLKLANSINAERWHRLDSAMGMKYDCALKKASTKQQRKFEILLIAQKPKIAGRIENKSNVVNLSHVSLKDNDTKVLEYGLNFAIAPIYQKKVPLKRDKNVP